MDVLTFPKLWTRDTLGRLRYWFMEIEQDEGKHRSGYGVDGSDPTLTAWTQARPKNVGRSNATSAPEQAASEIRNEYKKKLDRGFAERKEDAGVVAFVKPMLAQKFEPKRLKGVEWIAIQPKLDGIRCIITPSGAQTRQGKPIVTIPHIMELLAPVFREDPDLILDGELYNHDLKDDFNTITSLVRKTKPTQDDLDEVARSIYFYIYDVPSIEGSYPNRSAYIRKLVNELAGRSEEGNAGIEKVGCRFVPAITGDLEEAIRDQHSQNILAGFEGTMIRLPGKYEFKRTHKLLKLKDFKDDEFEIVEVQEGRGNWTGYAKRVELRMPDGRTFGAGIKGGQEQARRLLSEKDQYRGKRATVRFFTETPDGVPRFPVVVAFDPMDR